MSNIQYRPPFSVIVHNAMEHWMQQRQISGDKESDSQVCWLHSRLVAATVSGQLNSSHTMRDGRGAAQLFCIHKVPGTKARVQVFVDVE